MSRVPGILSGLLLGTQATDDDCASWLPGPCERMSHYLVLCSLFHRFISCRSPGGTPEWQHPCQNSLLVPMAPSLALGSYEVPVEGALH